MERISIWYDRRKGASVRQPHRVTWRDPEAGKKRRSRQFSSRKEAIRFLAAKRVELNAGPLVPTISPNAHEWGVVVEEYISRLANRSEKHQYIVKKAIDSFERFAQPKFITEITPALLDQYFGALRAGTIVWQNRQGAIVYRTYSPYEAAHDWRALRALFRFSVERDYLERSPMRTVDAPVLPNPEPVVPTEKQWLALLHAISDMTSDIYPTLDRQAWHLMILLAVVTGLDRSDLLKLQLADVTLGDVDTHGIGILTWHRGKRRRTTQHGNTQYHGLPSPVNDRVASRIGSLIDINESRLFPWTTFPQRQWMVIRSHAHFCYPFKSLRKVAATRTAEAAALQAAADEMGHSTINITRRHYTANRRIALALSRANATALPDLPPMPPFGDSGSGNS